LASLPEAVRSSLSDRLPVAPHSKNSSPSRVALRRRSLVDGRCNNRTLGDPNWFKASQGQTPEAAEIEGRPLGGIFDRVHIELSPDGQPAAARIYDFKTDKGPVDLHAKYKDLLDSYIAAAALLLGISKDKVQAEPLGVRAPQDTG